jgi:O-antigen ligase
MATPAPSALSLSALPAALALVFLLSSLLVGQFWRFPLLGQPGGLLFSDLAVLLGSLVAWSYFLLYRRLASPLLWLTLILFFLGWSLLTLLVNASLYPFSQVLVGFFYWLRLTSHLLLFPALLLLFSFSPLRLLARRLLTLTALGLSLLGLLQLIFFPNLAQEGWDPHRGRLFSTWLDPNLLGGFFLLILPALFVWAKHSLLARFAAPLVLLALLLTQSRSSFLALFLSLLILSPFLLLPKPPKPLPLLSILSLVITCLLLAFLFFPARLFGLLHLDATVQLRAESLRAAWPLAEEHALFGLGYNLYQFTPSAAGFASSNSPLLHSRAGTDNSFLNLWLTTGLPGLLLFLSFWFTLLRRLLVTFSPFPLAAALGLLGFLLQANFVNSLFYSHLLLTALLLAALALTTHAPPTSPS